MNLNSIPFNGLNTGVAPTVKQAASPQEKGTVSLSEVGTFPSSEYVHKANSQLSVAEQAIVKAIEQVNKALDGPEKRFEYSVHKKTGDIIVKIIDKKTNEIIREIPPEKIVDLVAKLQEISGYIIDEKR